MDNIDAGEFSGARDDQIATTGQRPTDGFKRLAAHQDRMSHCQLFEPLLFTWEAPGDLIVLSNYPVPGHRNDRFHVSAQQALQCSIGFQPVFSARRANAFVLPKHLRKDRLPPRIVAGLAKRRGMRSRASGVERLDASFLLPRHTRRQGSLIRWHSRSTFIGRATPDHAGARPYQPHSHLRRTLDRNRRFDGRIRIVADQLEVLVSKIPKLLWGAAKVQGRQWARRAAQLLTDLLEMIPIDVDVSESMNKFSRRHTANNGNHLGQQCIGRNVERDTQKQVSAPLIQLTAQSSFLNVKLEHHVTGWQRHLPNLPWVPGGNNEPPTVGVFPNIRDQPFQLIDRVTFMSSPIAPLGPVNTSKIPLLIRPLVPDCHPIIHKESNIRFATYEPKQLERYGLEMHALGREKGESSGKIKSSLGPKIGNRAYAGAIFFGFAFFEN